VDENYTFHVMNYAAHIAERAETAIRAGGIKKQKKKKKAAPLISRNCAE
jgi:hypothetical protein